MDLSIVIPVYNEKENLPLLYDELKSILASADISYEVIFVDDGSNDGSFDILKDIFNNDGNIKIIKFRRNFGQTPALFMGFKYSKGKFIISMDGDLQNDPKDILNLYNEIQKGYDVVSGWRHNRKDSISKKLFSKISNWLVDKFFKMYIHDSGCTLKAYRKEAVNDLEFLSGETHRYIPALLFAKGYNIGEIKVNHRERRFGSTKYKYGRLVKGFLDLIFIKFWSSFSTRPIHFFGYIGVYFLIAGISLAAYKVFIELIIFHVPLIVGPLLLFSVLLTLTGLQFFTFGFLAEIMMRSLYTLQKQEFLPKVETILARE
ncbi:MAG: glycosyltransferase family 2 protein [Candidatus Methanoperedens sp.]|nr:glycosyltransferase family 2 protein [Candidatus Methanoperedens sp.]